MKTFRVYEVVTKIYAFNVEAENEDKAIAKIEDSFGGETDDIERVSEYDNVVHREYDCDGEI